MKYYSLLLLLIVFVIVVMGVGGQDKRDLQRSGFAKIKITEGGMTINRASALRVMDSLFDVRLGLDSTIEISGDTVAAVRRLMLYLKEYGDKTMKLEMRFDTAKAEYFKKVYRKEELHW